MAEGVVCMDVQRQEANVSQTELSVDAEIVCSEHFRKETVDLEAEMEIGAVTRDLLGKDVLQISQGLFQDDGDCDEDEDDDDSGTDYHNSDKSGTNLLRAERDGDTVLPDTFQTNHLLYYERFKAYQDYMLGDCKTSEVKAFTADYLEKVVEPCDWQAVWCTDVFDVLVEVVDVDYKEMKAKVELPVPLQCETRGCELTEEAMRRCWRPRCRRFLCRSSMLSTRSQETLTGLHCPWNISGFSTNISGESGMKRMRMMTLTTLCDVWSLASGCEYYLP
ncbi:SHC SH2 domain-binding protein 1 homolog B-like [Clupea harengus]|uniref:SHC SH2 domain-binding protein 1 homolog B-like n=1 Tax=Clupea harengus TaxID=7950 RepID=A0A8M1KET9_CLUHA|nr:SHC SH2 domain-binding protein 1 homolog B-like [Clupea harengus]